MKFHVTIKTLTPLHIGCGRELLKGYDFMPNPAERKTYVLDQDAIYMEEYEVRGGEARLQLPAGQLKTLDQFKPGSKYVFYDLEGATHVERIQAVIKNHRMEPYIPGSSLKGAIRTALMAQAITYGMFKPDNSELKGPKDAAANWEREVFGENPNMSWMRALQVVDSRPLPLSTQPLECLNVSIVTGSRADAPIAVEAIRRKITLETEITIDELSLGYSELLEWEGKDAFLADFRQAIRAFSSRRIQTELKMARENRWEKRISFYESLLEVAEKVHARDGAVLQLGWGSGWTGTTIGLFLGKGILENIRNHYQLGRPQKAGRDWQPDMSKAFPASRRLRVPDEWPLGWIALDFQPAGQASERWKTLEAKARATRPQAPVILNTAQPGIKTSAPTSQSATGPAPAPTAPEPASRPVEKFSSLPKPGDRFYGILIDVQKNGSAYLEIPGLDPDSVMGILRPEDQTISKTLKVDARVICQVIALGPDPADKNTTLVRCRTS